MNLADFHAALARSFMLFMLIAAAWNAVAAMRRQPVSGSTWGILAIGEILAIVQGVVGVTLFLGGAQPGRSLHWLYGVTALLTLPAYYGLSRGRDDRTASWVYAGLCLFLFFIGYRAGVTGA
jgi:CDP-diglyceride synthetase